MSERLISLRIGSLRPYSRIKDISTIKYIPHLCILRANKNLIEDISFFEDSTCLQHLNSIDLAFNMIKELPKISLPRLKFLDLRNNQIETCENFDGHPNLEVGLSLSSTLN
jgi:Leucine-rich repeat (LRR) protein